MDFAWGIFSSPAVFCHFLLGGQVTKKGGNISYLQGPNFLTSQVIGMGKEIGKVDQLPMFWEFKRNKKKLKL